MLINVKKSGLWAFKGIYVEEIQEGMQEMNDDKAKQLIGDGLAELPKKEEPKPEFIEPVIAETEEKYILESAEKGKAGWWNIKFKGIENIAKVRAKTEDEAIAKAITEIEVE